MANLTRTQAQLVGANSTLFFLGQQELDDEMLFAFPGLDGGYATAMGWRGTIYPCRGVLRSSSQATVALAANDFHKIIYGAAGGHSIADLKRSKTIFDLFVGESTNIAKLYFDIVMPAGTTDDTAMRNLTIDDFQVGSSRYVVGATGAFIVVADYMMALRRVGP